jgi:U3 small nucleolar ribonucleoprotein protein IMP4
MRHDVPNVGPMSEQYPHLIFSNLTSKLGQRTMNILKYLFPVPKEDSHRTITFVNQDDYISFRLDNNKTKKDFFLNKINYEFLVIMYTKKMKVKLN